MKEKTSLEKYLGNTAIETAIAGGSILLGGVAALIPVLTNTLVNQRYQSRIKSELNSINQILEGQKEKIEQLNEAQFKVISESIAVILQTLDQEKIVYLRNSITN